MDAGPWSFGLSYSAAHSDEQYRGTDRLPGPSPEETDFRQTALHLGYRLDERWSFGATIPHLQIEREKMGTEVLHLSGLGDVAVNAAWRPFEDRSWQLLAGLELPTGEEQKSPARGVVPPTLLQLGSGTWDPLLGVRWSRAGEWLNHNVFAVGLFPLGESDAGLDPGEVVQVGYDVGRGFGAGWSASLGVEALHRGDEELLDQPIGNSGSLVWSARPGISWAHGTTRFTLRARVPFHVDVDERQLAPGPYVELAVSVMP